MDVHEIFMAQSTTEITHLISNLDTSVDSWKNTITKLAEEIVTEDIESADRLQATITLRAVLCSLYKKEILLESKKQSEKNCTKSTSPFYADIFDANCVNTIKHFLKTTKLSDEISLGILDILSLIYVLYFDESSIIVDLETLQYSIHSALLTQNDIKGSEIQLTVCYLNSLYLHQMSSGFEKFKYPKFQDSFLRNVRLCFELKNRMEFELLSTVLPKIVQVADPNEFLPEIWEMILTFGDNLSNTLSLIYQTADIWFPVKSDYDEPLINQTMDEKFWLLLLNALSDPGFELRKKALDLIKRVIDFANEYKTRGLKLGTYQQVKPLVCTGTDTEQESFKKNWNDFCLILEALEEKEKHKITPVLSLLKNLVSHKLEPDYSNTGIHSAWIRCVFLRILRHENIAVVEWGLLNVLELDSELLDDEFLSILLDALNNDYLYEHDEKQNKTTIGNQLIKFLNNAETTTSDLVSRFLVKASEKAWGSIALYYVIHALSMVKKVTSIWREVELEAVKLLAEINSDTHCQMLRFASHVELLDATTHFTTKPMDLAVLASTLSAFTTSKALIRGQPVWKRISAWVSKVVREEDARNFIKKICEQMASGNMKQDLNVKSFSLIIMLFYDGDLILDSKFCSGLAALHKLLRCLHEAADRPYANATRRNRTIALISYLLDLTSSKDCIPHELVCAYKESILQFIFKNLRNLSSTTHFDDIILYETVAKKFIKIEKSNISETEVVNYIKKFETEAWNIIEDAEYANDMQRVFGIEILYACLEAANPKLRNYGFIRHLCNTYKTLGINSEELIATKNEGKEIHKNDIPQNNVTVQYYRSVAAMMHEYVKDNSVDEYVPDINWISEVIYLLKVGGKDILVSVVGILSQIYYKEAISDMDNFKSALRLCWKSALDVDECEMAVEEITKLIFSSPFLESEETKELTIEFTNHLMEKVDNNPQLRIILVKGLKQAKGKFLSNFYNAVLTCLLGRTAACQVKTIKHQARSYVLECYKEVHSCQLSNIKVNPDATATAHAIILLHQMITDDPTHAGKLLQLIIAKLSQVQDKPEIEDAQTPWHKICILQILLILLPILEENDVQYLHSTLCHNILSENQQPSVRVMHEWLLIIIYHTKDTLRAKMWNLFDQCQDKYVDSLCSVVSIMYHEVCAQSALQQDFMNLAFKHIVPYCMVPNNKVRLYAQVVLLKLYYLALRMSYSKVTENYQDLYNGLKKTLNDENVIETAVKLQDDFYFTVFNPAHDYSLQMIFYELPIWLNAAWDELISPQLFDICGFKESNSHCLKLLSPASLRTVADFSADFVSCGLVPEEILACETY